jgi:transposase
MVDFSKLVDWIKLSPRYLLPIVLVTGFLLFASKDTLEIFGLAGLVSDYRSWLGLVFLLFAFLLVSAAITSGLSLAYRWIKQKRKNAAFLRRGRERLRHLSEPEKEILRRYIEGQTRTQYLAMSDGVVNGLVHEGILYRASTLSSFLDHFAYNIQPWAWDYLNDHPKLLS